MRLKKDPAPGRRVQLRRAREGTLSILRPSLRRAAEQPASATAGFAGDAVEPIVRTSETAHDLRAVGLNAAVPTTSWEIGAVFARTDCVDGGLAGLRQDRSAGKTQGES